MNGAGINGGAFGFRVSSINKVEVHLDRVQLMVKVNKVGRYKVGK